MKKILVMFGMCMCVALANEDELYPHQIAEMKEAKNKSYEVYKSYPLVQNKNLENTNSKVVNKSDYDTTIENTKDISDPLSGYNRVMYHVNDVVYTYAITPVAKTWNFVVPDAHKTALSNFFHNLLYPVRLVNNLLQGEGGYAWDETKRFLVNTTLGMGGLADVATTHFNMPKHNADFGQTLGVWGVGEGPYIVWPLLGPSTLRSSFGMIGDGAANPINYMRAMDITDDKATPIYVDAGFRLNDYALKPNQYLKFKEKCEGRDCYVYQRDLYIEGRRKKLNNR